MNYLKKLFELDEDHHLAGLDSYDIDPIMDPFTLNRSSFNTRAANNGINEIADDKEDGGGDGQTGNRLNHSQSVSLRFDDSIFASSQDRENLQNWVLASVPSTYRSSLKPTVVSSAIVTGDGAYINKGLYIIIFTECMYILI